MVGDYNLVGAGKQLANDNYGIHIPVNSSFFDVVCSRKAITVGSSFNYVSAFSQSANPNELIIVYIDFDTSKLFYEAETDLSVGANGQVVSDADASNGNAVKTLDPTTTGFIVYGPYIGTLPTGNYRIFYRLKVSDNTITTDEIRLDVNNATDAVIVAKKYIKPSDFSAANTYQYFYLDTTIEEGKRYEFRVYKNGTANVDVYVDYVLVVPISNGKNFPQDIAHDAMRLAEPRRVLKVR